MRLSTRLGRTLREAPGDVDNLAYQLMVRAGMVRPLLAGGVALLPLGMLVHQRIETIMHEELGRIAGQLFRTPIIQATTAWERTGRYARYGPQMLRLRDRSDRALIVAPTHEEAVAELAQREIDSYRQLPMLIYQIHTKYRDELRVRGGLLRLREFTMLDAYSFDASPAGLDETYAQVASAFERIFELCGVRWVAVEAAAGEMGGWAPREYMALSSAGEDTLVVCDSCSYAANVEVASARAADSVAQQDLPPVEELATPACATIAELAAFLAIPESATAKAVFFDTPERGLIFVVIRGDLEVNEMKLRAVAEVTDLRPATLEQIAATGAVAGYASPVGLGHGLALADRSVTGGVALVAGANRAGYHLRNVVHGRDWQASQVADLATVQAGDRCERCAGTLRLERGIELGHIFKLGTMYSEALDARFVDQQGVSQPIIMGSYGIGVERLMQVLVEQHHDAQGIIWPPAVAPFQIHLLALGTGAAVSEAAEQLYGALTGAGIATLYDDRAERAGVKFNDADLLGVPLRVVVSERLLAEQAFEVKPRTQAAQKLRQSDALEALIMLINEGAANA